MQIKLDKYKSIPVIEIKGKNQVAHIARGEEAVELLDTNLDEECDVLIVPAAESDIAKVTKAGGLVLTTAGEYEKNGLFVSIQHNRDSAVNATNEASSKQSDSAEDQLGDLIKKLEIIEIEVDAVRVMYYTPGKDINRTVLNQLGIIDVLFVEVTKDMTKVASQAKAVSSIDPQIIIPIGENAESVSKFKAELGIKFEQEQKLKFKQQDFINEEFVIQGYELVP